MQEDGSKVYSYYQDGNKSVEVLRIFTLHDRIYVEFVNVGKVTVNFGAKFKYWDSRYRSGFSHDVSTGITFNVTRNVVVSSTDQTSLVLSGDMIGAVGFDFNSVKIERQN